MIGQSSHSRTSAAYVRSIESPVLARSSAGESPTSSRSAHATIRRWIAGGGAPGPIRRRHFNAASLMICLVSRPSAAGVANLLRDFLAPLKFRFLPSLPEREIPFPSSPRCFTEVVPSCARALLAHPLRIKRARQRATAYPKSAGVLARCVKVSQLGKLLTLQLVVAEGLMPKTPCVNFDAMRSAA